MSNRSLLRNNENVRLLDGVPDGKQIVAPTPAERRTLWLLLSGGLLSVLVFVGWFVSETSMGYWPLFMMLTLTIGFKLLRLLHEWYHYAAITVIPPPPVTREWKVDMLTTFFAGEPYDMVIDTLKAMQAVRYPHTSYLCDEANDPYLKQVCEELGVVHVYRGENKVDAKAGNINHTLYHVATGEIAVVLDPDHKPRPDFLDKTLPYFEDDTVGFVQCVQAYGNQPESLIAKGAAEHTYHFYGPMMMSMNRYGTVQAIGANCTFRRAALDSIGGHAAGLSEDMHTAMRLHSAGWKSVYVPENLSRGLVPATLSSFYKQQLKWSRGTFDLLFYHFPKLVKGFTWRQVIHYITIPLYFLSGLISAVDMFLPMLALVLGKTPVFVDLKDMAQVLLPVLIFLVLNRLYVQKWTLDRTEKGLHFWGGVLLLNTWWVYLTGFIYAIFRVKVPYIPTPKGDGLKNEWLISIPNIVVMILGVLSIAYGLSIDWGPYSWFMASLVGINIFMLGIGVLIAQRKLTHRAYVELLEGKWSGLRRRWADFRYDVLYLVFRSKKLVAGLASVMLAVSSMLWMGVIDQNVRMADLEAAEKQVRHQYDGFLWGGDMASEIWTDETVQEHVHMMSVSFTDTTDIRPVRAVLDAGYIPYIRWHLLPDQPLMSWYRDIVDSCYDQAFLATELRLSFCQEALRVSLDLARPDSLSPEGKRRHEAAWRHIVGLWRESQVADVRWVWEVNETTDDGRWFPGEEWIDAWALKGTDAGQIDRDLQTMYEQYPALVQCPFYLTHVPAEALATSTNWHASFAQAKDMQGMLIQANKSQALVTTVQEVSETYALSAAPLRILSLPPLPHEQPKEALTHAVRHEIAPAHQRVLRHPDGRFDLLVDGEPFYMKGVAYNPGHDWRDGYAPLVLEVLQRDFKLIKEMGANTIRRYSPSVYDHNILNAAEAADLKVLYGFWFDPKIDYYTDTEAVEDYKHEVIEGVRRFQDHPAVLGWSIGNETWGLIKQYCDPDYTYRVRRAYLLMLEDIAREIHRIDPSRPVFSMLEHSPKLVHGLEEFHRLTPSIDVLGINSYYRSYVSRLDTLVQTHAPGMPYLVSEFGPRGYWNPEKTWRDNHLRLIEQSDLEKAQYYYQQWQLDIAPNRGKNVGGVAFCWRDRMEGSLTWFGLTDFENRRKLGYHALRRAWREDTSELDPMTWFDVRIINKSYSAKTHEFRLVVPPDWPDRYNITWQLVQDNYLQEIPIPAGDQGSLATVVRLDEVPTSDNLYRIYAYIDDYRGNVLTASYPISAPYSYLP